MAKTGTYGIDINAQNGDIALSNNITVANNATVSGTITSDVVVATTTLTASAAVVLSSYATLDFLNDGAAATGGVALGGVYHTAGALKVRVA